MARVTPEELKAINDNTQILLRLGYMLRQPLRSIQTTDQYQKNDNAFGNAFLRMAELTERLDLEQARCACQGNKEVQTHGWVARERGYQFECAQCGRIYIWNTLAHRLTLVGYTENANDGQHMILSTKNSSWIVSIQGTWNKAKMRIDNVYINKGHPNEIHYDYMPYDVWQSWSWAESMGTFWHKHIKYSPQRGWGNETV